MPLQITKTVNGITAKDWDIVELYYNTYEKQLIAWLRGFDSKAKRDEAKNGARTALLELKFSFSGADFPNVSQGNLLKTVENLIKQSPIEGGWSNAVIVV